MDELDLLLESLPDASQDVQVVSDSESDDSPVMIAMDEFQNATNPKDRLEALKLLIALTK